MATTTTSRRITTGLIASVQSHSAIGTRSMISLIRRNHHHIKIRVPSPIPSRRWLIEAVVPPQAISFREGSDDDDGGAQADAKTPGVCGYAITGNEIDESSGDLVDGDQQHVNTIEMVMWAAATAAFGVANRVMYKLALVPLKQYPFFLAQLSTFGFGLQAILSWILLLGTLLEQEHIFTTSTKLIFYDY